MRHDLVVACQSDIQELAMHILVRRTADQISTIDTSERPTEIVAQKKVDVDAVTLHRVHQMADLYSHVRRGRARSNCAPGSI